MGRRARRGREGWGKGDECMGDASGEGVAGGGKGPGQLGGVPGASGAHVVHAPQFKSRFSVSGFSLDCDPW